jgi:hypothetical protein
LRRVSKNRRARHVRHYLFDEFQPFSAHAVFKVCEPGYTPHPLSLLRPPCERLRAGRAAEQCDEVAPSHVLLSASRLQPSTPL